MTAVAGQLGVIPGAVYGTGTMTEGDLYPRVAGIGGIRTQDYTIPAYSERIAQAHGRSLALGAAQDQVSLATPAGWLALGVVVIIAGVWLIR
jgi:hypothetical protein